MYTKMYIPSLCCTISISCASNSWCPVVFQAVCFILLHGIFTRVDIESRVKRLGFEVFGFFDREGTVGCYF